MRKLLSILLLTAFTFSCLDEVPVTPDQPDHTNYFPVDEGSYYKYDVVQTDSNGISTTAERIVRLKSDTMINRTSYSIQIDSILNGTTSTTSKSYLRKSNSGIFYFADTTGFLNFFPDSLRSYVELQTELRTQLFPLLSGSMWTVYRISVKILGLLNYNVVDINGRYIKDEELSLNINGEVQILSTKKIQYTYKLILDAFSEPIVFNSYIWLAENIGIVKMEGSAVLLSIFGGGLLLSTDTAISATQTLVQYRPN